MERVAALEGMEEPQRNLRAMVKSGGEISTRTHNNIYGWELLQVLVQDG